MLGIFALVFILFFIFIIFTFMTVINLKGDSAGSKFGKKGEGRIGVVSVNGVILKSKPTIELLIEAEEDKNIDAIIVRIDSPGGAVAPTQEIFNELRRIDEIKPVYASFGSIAASGGYYIGAAARKIYASPGTLTGSIGVIMNFANLEKLFEFIKIKPEVIKSGNFKDIGNSAREMTVKEKELMNNLVKNVHQQFINDILSQRKERLNYDIDQLAQGQIFSGEQAKEYGLVDELQSLWDAGRSIHKDLKLSGEFGLKYITKEKDFKLSQFLKRVEEASSKIGEVVGQTEAALLYLYRP
jgi:protease-4